MYKLGFPINVPGATVEYAHTQCTRNSYNEGSIISSQHIKWHIGVSRGKVLFYKWGGGGVLTSPPLGGTGGMLPREDLFLNIEVKFINLVHFESKYIYSGIYIYRHPFLD